MFSKYAGYLLFSSSTILQIFFAKVRQPKLSRAVGGSIKNLSSSASSSGSMATSIAECPSWSAWSPEDPKFKHFYVFDEVSSTMDKAKEMATEAATVNELPIFAVLADNQTKGRGTRGRNWFSSSNNMFLTVSIKLDSLPIAWTLIPLKVGTLIYPHIKAMTTKNNATSELADVKLKWPNDVLINGRKVCGVLIEIEKNRMLIGIGCNVGSAPAVVQQPISTDTSAETIKDIGRPSACLGDFNPSIKEYYSKAPPPSPMPPRGTVSPHHSLARSIFHSMSGWVEAHSEGYLGINGEICDASKATDEAPETIAATFESVMDFKPQKLRPDSFSQYVKNNAVIASKAAGEATGASSTSGPAAVIYDPVKETENVLTAPVIMPKGINTDGTLRVIFQGSDSEVNLVADYIW